MSVALRSGARMPLLGLGTWRSASRVSTKASTSLSPPTASAPLSCEDAVVAALKNGYRLVDTAARYANEESVGCGLARALREVDDLERKNVFVTTKLPPDCHEPKSVPGALESALKKLDLSYVDLYLVHFPLVQLGATPVPLFETWKAMIELRNAGLARDIGVSNVPGALLNDLMASCGSQAEKDWPAVLQIERHPRLPQHALVEFAHSRGIAVTAFSSLGTREFATSADSLKARPSPDLITEIEPVVQAVGRSAAQVLLRWSVQNNVAVIPKSSHEHRIVQNAQIFDFQLEADHMSWLDTLAERLGEHRFLLERHHRLGGVPIY